jgi:putative Ca2+/H+ antiporter (TMEM165/GDT1 family)
VILVAELPDKTMFASLLMATKGRAAQVWVGAAAVFLVHVVIATTVGVAIFALSAPPGDRQRRGNHFLVRGGIRLAGRDQGRSGADRTGRRAPWSGADGIRSRFALVAAVSGKILLRLVNVSMVRKVTAVLLLALAALSVWEAVT